MTELNLLSYLLDAASAHPSCTALVDSLCSLTYTQLLNRSFFLSQKIQEISSPSKHSPIALLLPKDATCITSLFAALFCNAPYSPLDLSLPVDRLAKILVNLEPSIIIYSHLSDDILDLVRTLQIPTLNITDIEFPEDPVLADLIQDRYQQIIATHIDLDPAYIIFTSGSTGTPKGVTVSHRSISDYIEWAASEYTISSSDRFCSQAPFYFDNSVLDIFLAVKHAASIYIPEPFLYSFSKLLLDYVRDHSITILFWVPSILASLSDDSYLLEIAPFLQLRYVLFAGEQMSVSVLNKWITALPNAIYSNLYGPTEVTVDCTFFTLTSPYQGPILPIGKPCRNSDVFVLSDADTICSPGDVGQLCVRGTSLALGYWNDISLTETVFVQNPLHSHYIDPIYKTGDLVKSDDEGNLYFVGRVDTQIKRNGYRIELGEIEAAASSLTNVISAVCLFESDSNRLILFVQPSTNCTITRADFRTYLSCLLPKYMIPDDYVLLKTFPVTPNSKIDRRALSAMIKPSST